MVEGVKVSVVTVCRNALATLGTTIDSVVRQTYPNIEHIVIDGASSDGTPAYLKSREGDLAYFMSEADNGIYDAMNKGLARATGDVVHFLNADDYFFAPDSVERAVRFIEAEPGVDLFYGDIEVRLPNGECLIHVPRDENEAAETMVCGCLPHQGTFVRRRVFDRTGPFDTRWRIHADYDWFLKAIADDEIALRHIPVTVASFALGGGSSDLARGQPEVHAIQNALPLYQTPEWLRRRVELYQEAFLAVRLENAELKRRLDGLSIADTSPRSLARRLRERARRALIPLRRGA